MSSAGQDSASPAGETTMVSTFDSAARSRPGTILRGMDIDPPPPNFRSIASVSKSYRASTTDDGSATRDLPRARACAYRSRSFVVISVVAMNSRPFPSQPCRVSGHQALRSVDFPIGDRADDLDSFMGRQVDLHYGASLPDVHVRRRMIEGVNPHLEARLTDDCRHDT